MRGVAGVVVPVVAVVGMVQTAAAGDMAKGWDWLARTNEIQTEGAIWNDRIGDGKDRWKTGGLTQSYVLPEHIFSEEAWFAGRASAFELNVRGLVITPDNTANVGVDGSDRPYAQYVGVGGYLRSATRPRQAELYEISTEDRIGIELGWQGDPLPLFDIQEALHDMFDTGGSAANLSNTIDGEFLANVEARHTRRYHFGGGAYDVEFAPFAQLSAGMRENSLRVGTDVFFGSSLEGRTWGSEPATGAVLAGAASPREGFNWTVFFGGDVGYIASDAFLDGGFAGDGPSVERKDIVGRARMGVMLEYDRIGVAFSMNWLGTEFEGQSASQAVGAVQLKYRF